VGCDSFVPSLDWLIAGSESRLRSMLSVRIRRLQRSPHTPRPARSRSATTGIAGPARWRGFPCTARRELIRLYAQ
jgi:hypothetical protein